MITSLGDNVFIEVDPDEFQLSNWVKFRKINVSPIQGLVAQTRAEGAAPTFEIGVDGSDIIVTRVQGRVKLDSANCWVVTGTETDALLNHEQGHYYIMYIPYVIMLQDIRALKVPITQAHIPPHAPAHLKQTLMHNAIALKIRSMIRQVATKTDQLALDYDAVSPGTDHGRNKTEQDDWNSRFSQSLTSGKPL